MAPPVATVTVTATVEARPVPVTIATRPDALDGIELVDDLDTLAGNEVMRGCGNDNPY